MKYLFRFISILLLLPAILKAQKKQAASPNIIFILVDDQGYGDLGVFFQNQRKKTNDRSKPWQSSPNLDRLAAGGATLTQHYCAAPVCAPSRASIMLGVSQGHANIRDNQFDKALEDNYSMPSTLRQLGYSTALIGKWGLQGNNKKDTAATDWPAHPLKRGFDYALSYMRHKDGHEHYPKEGLYDGPKQVWENHTNIADGLDKCYTADLWTAAAKRYIINQQEQNKNGKPFFMYLAYETPHAVLELPTMKYPDGAGLTGGMQWTGKPGHMITTADGQPDTYIHPDYANATYDHDSNTATPEIPWPETYKRYATANRRIDDGVGDIMQLLHDLKIDSNTVIVYTSDNGPSIESYLPKTYTPNHPTFFGSYGPFDGIKRDDLEGGVRMPTIANWPGHIKAGNVITSPSISYDWAVTFLEMAGSVAPARMDGISLVPSLTGDGKQQPGIIYNEYFNNMKTPDFAEFSAAHRGRQRNQMQFIRVGDYVGVRYDIKSASDAFEIYDVMKDPAQRNNLAVQQNTAGNAKMEELERWMKARVLEVRRPNLSAPRPYDSTLVASLDVRVDHGIDWQLYAGSFPWLPQVTSLKPTKKGSAASFNALPAITVASGVLVLNGYIKAPVDGEYSFFLQAAKPAFLRIHDAQLIDAAYKYTGKTEKSGTILLKAGYHPYTLSYKIANKEAPSIKLEWKGPDGSRQSIPANSFYR